MLINCCFFVAFKFFSNFQIEIPSSGKSRRFRSRDARRSLFLGKRLAEDQDVENFSPATKKARETDEHLQVSSTMVRFLCLQAKLQNSFNLA